MPQRMLEIDKKKTRKYVSMRLKVSFILFAIISVAETEINMKALLVLFFILLVFFSSSNFSHYEPIHIQ